ncbi:MAG: hypothetical protein ABSG68_06770 [Thermoguttaceae bacterium]
MGKQVRSHSDEGREAVRAVRMKLREGMEKQWRGRKLLGPLNRHERVPAAPGSR